MLPTKATTINIKIDKDFSLWEVGGKFKTMKLSLCYPLPFKVENCCPYNGHFPKNQIPRAKAKGP